MTTTPESDVSQKASGITHGSAVTAAVLGKSAHGSAVKIFIWERVTCVEYGLRPHTDGDTALPWVDFRAVQTIIGAAFNRLDNLLIEPGHHAVRRLSRCR